MARERVLGAGSGRGGGTESEGRRGATASGSAGVAGSDEESRRRDAALRPKWLREVIGQRKVAERLAVAVAAAKKLGEPLGHILF
ncbi:MAG: hypothetical protein NZ703_05430, partial [Gemmataceae bacterium]|nr:hypothetical protein [Gemmataceae bacterium]